MSLDHHGCKVELERLVKAYNHHAVIAGVRFTEYFSVTDGFILMMADTSVGHQSF